MIKRILISSVSAKVRRDKGYAISEKGHPVCAPALRAVFDLCQRAHDVNPKPYNGDIQDDNDPDADFLLLTPRPSPSSLNPISLCLHSPLSPVHRPIPLL